MIINGTNFADHQANHTTQHMMGSIVMGKGKDRADSQSKTILNNSGSNYRQRDAATLDISKSGYASLAYNNKPGVVSGKTIKEVYEKLGIVSDLDAMRMMDPEAYKTFMSLPSPWQNKLDGKPEEADNMGYLIKWVEEQMLSNKPDIRAVAYNGIKGLKSRYGDDTEINVSSPDENDARGDIWRFRGDYNILLTPEQMQSWINDDPEEDNLKALLKSLDESMKELCEEKEKYNGDHEGLMLGLSIDEDNSPLFHATFKGNTAGDITATTAQELFAKLNTSD